MVKVTPPVPKRDPDAPGRQLRSAFVNSGGWTGQRDEWEQRVLEVVTSSDHPDLVQIGNLYYYRHELEAALKDTVVS